MSNHNLDLKFSDPLKYGLPGPPSARIFVKTSTRDEGGFTFITNSCMSLEDLRSDVRRLKKELDNIMKRGEKFFLSK